MVANAARKRHVLLPNGIALAFNVDATTIVAHVLVSFCRIGSSSSSHACSSQATTVNKNTNSQLISFCCYNGDWFSRVTADNSFFSTSHTTRPKYGRKKKNAHISNHFQSLTTHFAKTKNDKHFTKHFARLL